jgi:Tfp pilus assembly protein PilF
MGRDASYWGRRGRGSAASLACALLAACATPGPEQAPDTSSLLHDDLFATASHRVSADDVFALSEAMHTYLRTTIAEEIRTKGPYRGLFDALYSQGQLKLDYDASITRNAAQAFDARAGNCLSLVIMTGAFAKALGVEVQYQSVIATEKWSRNGDLYLGSGHVNLVLGRPFLDPRTREERSWRIDFRPPEEIRGYRTRVVSEQTIVAMYLNNRAAESLVQGELDEAYWWAREAVMRNPAFLSAYNTLGVVYMRRGHLSQAERAFRYILDREPRNLSALSNLAQVLRKTSRATEASELAARLKSSEPYPPFHFFDLGIAAMEGGNYKSARDYFAAEIGRDAYHHEFHFWLAMAYSKLGNAKSAERHLRLAIEHSTTPAFRDSYLAALNAMVADEQRKTAAAKAAAARRTR